MGYDVLLVDEQVGEGFQLRQEWADRGVRVIQCESLDELGLHLSGTTPAKWPDPPYEFAAAIVDLDLGLKSEGPVGGLLVAHRLHEWAIANHVELPIVLRTSDIDDDRSLAAVLTAELLDAPLPWWGKSSDEAHQLLEYLDAVVAGKRVRPAEYGATLIHPVDVVLLEGPEKRLGSFLFDGARPRVWRKVLHTDIQTAPAWAGYGRHTKFWDDLSPVFEAVNHLREDGAPLHLLAGKQLRVSDVELAIAEKEAQDLDEVAAAVEEGRIEATPARRATLIRSLRERRDRFLAWIDDLGERPHRKNQVEQGEFLASYDRVLGHPDVIDLFEAKYAG